MLVISGVCLFLTMLIYLLFHRIAFKNVFKSLKSANRQKYGFYECGFRPRHEYTATFEINTYTIIAIAILYDIECIYLIILLSGVQYLCILDIVIALVYISTFIIGFYFERAVRNTEWRYN